MNESFDDLHDLAGEYVLGTLSLSRRQEVERRLPQEAALRAAVDDWEQRLLPLTALAEPQQPSTQLWRRIEQSLPMPRRVRQAGGWPAWWSSLSFWRWLAAGSFACMALLITFVVNQFTASAPPPTFMVVLMEPQQKSPGWVIQISNRRQLNLIPLGPIVVPQEKALQFWTKGTDWKGPVSLGLIKPGNSQQLALDKLPPLQPNQLFEITLEPPTGSLTGKPSGPVLYIGKAVKVT
ncbi:anti-sigma factor domain-containing protein [Glaciimonas sp. PCH181]|uniref:anti-sigma factor n=1 Tax=Glaciimonas sp. PCH181 TaxID=2133943 RepID=UPI000D3A08E8|nr:anti-sigma factor [Glaciimonas sp. PCH181]PUA20273.1 RNA polymerase subunit sigma-70 [Glaciimonas sp. PCH181]